MLELITYVNGAVTAWVFGKYVLAVNALTPFRAAFWDFFVVFLASGVTLTLWSKSNDSILVLLAYALGNSTGTLVLVSRARRAARVAAQAKEGGGDPPQSAALESGLRSSGEGSGREGA
ncbi:MAG: hypothetical protein GTO63_25510 [Anaerolineae bacterium]|nr:hypothetical protein [Anaerolineae bacterium]NIQ77234.1 hypothetical protein [Anaerolineae bacterium]